MALPGEPMTSGRPLSEPDDTVSPAFGAGVLRIAGRDSVVDAMRETEERKALKQDSPAVKGLLGYLLAIWDTNRRFKREEGIHRQMVENLRARKSEYDEDKLSAIRSFGGSDIFMGLTGVKCRAAESWLFDVLSAAEKPWSIMMTPIPEGPKGLTEKALANAKVRIDFVRQQFTQQEQEAPEPSIADLEAMVNEELEKLVEDYEAELRERTTRMENKIHDQMVEGGWADAFEEFLSDLVTLKVGIIKGPIPRIRQITKWERDEVAQRNIPVVVDQVVPEYERVSPFDFYPSPEAVCVNDGSLVERVKFTRRDLTLLKGQPGYDAKVLDEVLLDSSFSTYRESTDDFESERDDVEQRDTVNPTPFTETLEGLEFWCSVQGRMLLEHGVEKMPGTDVRIDPVTEYQVNAIVVGRRVIYVNSNDNPLGLRPYFKCGWTRIPGSFWYEGVPELMSDLQQVCNASMRALVNNLAVSSGPQAEVDVNRLLPGESIDSISPMKIWQTTNRGNNASPAIRFFQPESNANELLAVYDHFARLADDYTGIPAYAYGNDQVAGAGRTSSGLSMLMSSAAKGIKRVLMDVEKQVIRGVIKRQFEWNKQYLGSEFQGDINVVPTGVVALMVREQMSDRRMRFLEVTNNEQDAEIVGIEGRAAILREAAQSLEIPGHELTLSEKRLRALVKEKDQQRQSLAAQQQQAAEAQNQMMQMQMQAAQLDMQIKQIEAEGATIENQLKIQSAQLDQTRLELEIQKIQQEAQLKGMELDIKGKKVEAEAIKDYAVAADLGARGMQGLMQARQEQAGGPMPAGEKGDAT